MSSNLEQVLKTIIDRAEGEEVPSKRVDLLFLIDSITQHAFQLFLKDKRSPERDFPRAVQECLPRLLTAVLPPGRAEAEPDNYHQCLKVRQMRGSGRILQQHISAGQCGSLLKIIMASARSR